MSEPVNYQHHEVAFLAAQAAKDRSHGTPASGMNGMGTIGALMPAQAAKAVTDAYKAALADLNPSPAKVVAIKAEPRKATRRRA